MNIQLKKRKIDDDPEIDEKTKKNEERKKKMFQREVDKLKKEAIRHLNETEWMFQKKEITSKQGKNNFSNFQSY